jgi:hypothetical protein
MARKLFLIFSAVFLFAALLPASPVTFQTPYIISDPYAGPTGSQPTTGDVKGDFTKFDINVIKFLQLDSTLVKAEIDLNYDEGDTTLSQFTVGSDKLNIGDLLFGDGSGHYSYGVALRSHSVSPNPASIYSNGGLNVLAGALYQIHAGGILLAQDVLGYSGTGFNPSQAVWMWNGSNSNTLTQVSNPVANAVSVSPITGKEIAITVSFAPTVDFMNALYSGSLFVHFTSATCANDFIDGQLQPVPEPAAWSMMFGAALVGLGLWRRKSRAR